MAWANGRRRRALRLLKAGKSDGDMADVLERRNALQRRIRSWADTQAIYMPSVTQLRVQTNTFIIPPPNRADSGDDADDLPPAPDVDEAQVSNPEDIALWLPSGLPPSLRIGELTSRLMEIERRFRLAQLDDSLADIRRFRRILKGISEFKRLNVSGTGNKPNTRIRALYTKFQRKQHRLAERYRAAFRALLTLDPTGNWQVTFRELLDCHLTGPGRDDDGVGEGHHEILWIWLAARILSADDDEESREYDDTMRAEWARSKARADRWEEEVELLVEEMHRVVMFLEAESTGWQARADARVRGLSHPRISFDIEDGVRAFAMRHAAVYQALAFRFASTWAPLLNALGRPPKWSEEYTAHAGVSSTDAGELSEDLEELEDDMI